MSSAMDAQLKQLQEQLLGRQDTVDKCRLREQARSHAKQEREATEEPHEGLNDLTLQDPELMSGTSSIPDNNPKVVDMDFDTKRNYFTQHLHSRDTEPDYAQPLLRVVVRRDQVLFDSCKSLHFRSRDEIKYGKLSIYFPGENGIDAEDATHEWFRILARQIFNPDYVLFIPVASDPITFHPSKLSKVNDEHLMYFKVIGRIIGKMLYEGHSWGCHLSKAVYKRILGKTVSIKDMETHDPECYRSLLWMLENDISNTTNETFSIETDEFGVPETVDLIEHGRNIPVTEETKQQYVQLTIEYRLMGSVQEQLEHLIKGTFVAINI